VIERKNRVLVAQRPLGKRHGGLWEFPGGKVEDNESDFDALQRELEEELGMRVIATSQAIMSLPDDGSQFLIVFVPVVTDGEPECREHEAVRWAAWSELAMMPLAPTDRRFVALRTASA